MLSPVHISQGRTSGLRSEFWWDHIWRWLVSFSEAHHALHNFSCGNNIYRPRYPTPPLNPVTDIITSSSSADWYHLYQLMSVRTLTRSSTGDGLISLIVSRSFKNKTRQSSWPRGRNYFCIFISPWELPTHWRSRNRVAKILALRCPKFHGSNISMFNSVICCLALEN